MKVSSKLRVPLVIVTCAALGAAAGIGGSMAASGSKSGSEGSKGKPNVHHGHRGGPMGPGGPAVHVEAVVLNKAGDGFITRTDDRGTIKSISGGAVTITQAIGSVTYKDIVVNIPENATIVRNGQQAKVSDLKAGDRIQTSQSSEATFVFAADANWRPEGRPGRGFPHPDRQPPGQQKQQKQ